MKKSAFQGGAMPAISRAAVLAVAIGSFGCLRMGDDPAEPHTGGRLVIKGLDARALTIDTNGYVGEICIGDFGCYLDGKKDTPFELPPGGPYEIYSHFSIDYDA